MGPALPRNSRLIKIAGKIYLLDISLTPMRRLVDATALAAYRFNEAAARANPLDSSAGFSNGPPLVFQ